MIKKILFLFILNPLFLSFYTSAKELKPFIPNCVDIYEGRIFMSKTETTNLNYLEFLYHQKSRLTKAAYQALLPDTLVWRDKFAYSAPYVDYYLRHPAYSNYPVVGLTHDQAEKYCQWLSEILTAENRKNVDSDVDSVLVRLPTQKEWIYAAQGGFEHYEYPWSGTSLRFEDGKFQGDVRANFLVSRGDYMGVAGLLHNMSDITAPVVSYWPNHFGLYHCAGNVAEMVGDKMIAVGGSWASMGHDIRVNAEIPFLQPSSKIGFRYLVEVKKKKAPIVQKQLKIDAKWLKQNFVAFGDSLLVQKFEVSNLLYNQFLKETKTAAQDTVIWMQQFPYSDYFVLNYRWHPDFYNYPAVGMDRNNALAFCTWLKEKLVPIIGNSIEVELPTEKNWIMAARGILSESPYPWGGPYLRNSKGCVMANHRFVPESFMSKDERGNEVVVLPKDRHEMYGADEDGAMGTAAVNSYQPNGVGIYNMAGNVREMVQEKNFTKGGGWKSNADWLSVETNEPWNEKPSPAIGFRVVIRKG